MYKIYINENTLILTESESMKEAKVTEKTLIAPYTGKTKMLLSYIDMLEKTNRFEKITIHYFDVKRLLKDFESLFTTVKAAGGLVLNEENKCLFIFRRGFWDLPKGKIDKGEKKKAAAIREVQEETGVESVEIVEKLKTTRHAYRLKDKKRAIKKTFWYVMKAKNQPLIPQTEEDIEQAVWLDLEPNTDFNQPIFKSIEDLLNLYLENIK